MEIERQKIRLGDLVEVKSANEIAATLDSDGTLDRLPFMPEMISYCGNRFRVSQKVVIVCSSGTKTGSVLRSFQNNDVVLLEGLRCSGAEHDGCQKSCTIFWREAWLRKIDKGTPTADVTALGAEQLRSSLKTKVGPNKYFCQASELVRSTKALSKRERYAKCIDEVRFGNCGLLDMVHRIVVFLFWKVHRAVFGHYAKGRLKPTPIASLNLEAGELVQVKPLENISCTLDENASNRGLWFSPSMRLLCHQQRKVERRIEKLIVDGTGEMRQLKNTVFLEDSHCSCPHIALGGCSRQEYVYWREIWLQRSSNSTESNQVTSMLQKQQK
jgi:hypothetical protein